ncbi:MAG TPA: hypothetical protein PLO33_16025, partial [Kouleothrix sp.]|nr:hypothetical protein [Kouleothrix sp.]
MLRRANRIALAGLMVLLALFALAPAAGAAPLRQADSVDVDDQAIKDGTLVIAEINATQDGWIVAHTDVNNKPGPVIGHTAVKKGESYKVEIKLEQAVAPGAKLWPMLHIDAGTIGTYEFPGPDVPVVVDNNIVMKQISITASDGTTGAAPSGDAASAASIDVDDQAVANGSIEVAEINATEDGWIVVHTDVNDKPGPVIGHTAVKKGEAYKVAIKLEQAVAPGAKLWPMLHIDAGTIGTYEFPGPDVPVVVNNNIVMKQISVKAPGAAAPSKLPNTGGSAAPLAIAALGALLL